MMMGILSTEDEEHLESIVYFLSEALRGAIEVGDGLQQSPCTMPQIKPGMDCSEIAGQLAAFRQHVNDLWSCEMMLLTKLLRARELAKELRVYEQELRPEIDTFRLATVMAPDLRDMLMPDEEHVFNGAVHPKRFLEMRGYDENEGAIPGEPLLGYRIAGALDVRLLLDACETLHFGLAARYGVGPMPVTAHPLIPQEDEPFLLTDLGEIVTDDYAANSFGWHGEAAEAAMQPLRH
ncbi:MAG: hypothetical protein HC850_13080 [Rhodomicrobium sp.]|nr:hypothetical protein [Rhodomicrobium sp.]